jgi:hypothetical protein
MIMKQANVMRTFRILGICGLSLVGAPAMAQSAAPRDSEVGHSTTNWLDLQVSGREAGPPRPMLGAEASVSYGRYLDSFNHRIPEFFNSSLKASTGASSGAN